MKVAVIGGTGAMGNALARHLAAAHHVIIGSRDPGRALEAARGIPGADGTDYQGAARSAELIVLAIPYEGMAQVRDFAGETDGKLVISAINPMTAEGGLLRYELKDGSAAEELARLLPGSRIATAFNNIPSGFMKDEVVPPVDVLVAAESRAIYDEAAKLVLSIREMRPLYAGPLAVARIVEEITPLVLNLASLNGTRALATRFVTRKG